MHACKQYSEGVSPSQQCTLGAPTLVCLMFETFSGWGRGWVWTSSTSPFAVVPFWAISAQQYSPGPPALPAQPTDRLFIRTWGSSLLTSQLRRTQLRPCQQSNSHSIIFSTEPFQEITFWQMMCKHGDQITCTCCFSSISFCNNKNSWVTIEFKSHKLTKIHCGIWYCLKSSRESRQKVAHLSCAAAFSQSSHRK